MRPLVSTTEIKVEQLQHPDWISSTIWMKIFRVRPSALITGMLQKKVHKIVDIVVRLVLLRPREQRHDDLAEI